MATCEHCLGSGACDKFCCRVEHGKRDKAGTPIAGSVFTARRCKKCGGGDRRPGGQRRTDPSVGKAEVVAQAINEVVFPETKGCREKLDIGKNAKSYEDALRQILAELEMPHEKRGCTCAATDNGVGSQHELFCGWPNLGDIVSLIKEVLPDGK